MKKLLLALLISTGALAQPLPPKPPCPLPPCQVTTHYIRPDVTAQVQAAINAANLNDTLNVGMMEGIIYNQLVVNKSIVIIGAGAGKTIWERDPNQTDAQLSANCMLRLNINSNTPCHVVIQGITFRSTTNPASLAADIGIVSYLANGFEISNCNFEYWGEAGISVLHDDSTCHGYIHDCSFLNNVRLADPNGLGLGYGIEVYGTNKRWISSPRFGTNNFIFVENNSFDTQRHAITGGGGALFIFRYNRCANNKISHIIDTHDAYLGDKYGNKLATRAVEVYNNSLSNNFFTDGTIITLGKSIYMLPENAIMIRGGEALVHHNTISGYFRFPIGIANYQTFPKPTPFPVLGQPGYASDSIYGPNHSGIDSSHAAGDFFWWENDITLYPSTQEFWNYNPELFVEERDFHRGVAKPGYTPYPYPYKP